MGILSGGEDLDMCPAHINNQHDHDEARCREKDSVSMCTITVKNGPPLYSRL
jgi:hypothetical protein